MIPLYPSTGKKSDSLITREGKLLAFTIPPRYSYHRKSTIIHASLAESRGNKNSNDINNVQKN